MELQKVRDEWGRIAIEAVNDSDVGLFRHCSNGRFRVWTKDYNKYVEPMLVIHGVTSIKIIDRSRLSTKG